MTTGMLMAIFMDLADVLWFVPTIWAPMLICHGLARISGPPAVAHGTVTVPFPSPLVAGDR